MTEIMPVPRNLNFTVLPAGGFFRPLFVLPKNRGRKKFPPGFLGRLLKFSNNFGAENLRFFLVLLCRDPFCDASAARSFALAGSICGCPLCFHHRLCVIGPFCCRILAAARVFCLRRLLERVFSDLPIPVLSVKSHTELLL